MYSSVAIQVLCCVILCKTEPSSVGQSGKSSRKLGPCQTCRSLADSFNFVSGDGVLLVL